MYEMNCTKRRVSDVVDWPAPASRATELLDVISARARKNKKAPDSEA